MKKYLITLTYCLVFINLFGQSDNSEKRKTIILYEGAKRTLNEVALICKGSGYEYSGGLAHFGIGIENPLNTKKLKTINYNKCVEILPRSVYISVVLEYYGVGFFRENRWATLIFTVEAGHKYTIHGSSGPTPGAWAVDETTDKIVAKEGKIPDKFFSSNPFITQ